MTIKRIIQIDSVDAYNKLYGWETLHPLVTVVNHANPMAIYSFLEGYDFSGKTIVLFTTHGGNRFCRTVPTVRKLFPKANVVQGPAIYDREMDKAEQSLDEWLKDNELVN